MPGTSRKKKGGEKKNKAVDSKGPRLISAYRATFDESRPPQKVLKWLARMNEALMTGQFRAVADAYRGGFFECFLTNDSWEPWANYMLSGWTSILRNGEGGVVADERDWAALDEILKSEEPPHIACAAAFCRAILRFDARDRESAARDYRRVLVAAQRATPAELAGAVVASLRGVSTVEEARVIVARESKGARANLDILEGATPSDGLRDEVLENNREATVEVGASNQPIIKGRYTASNFATTVGHRDLVESQNAPNVLGGQCDGCGVKRIGLKMCTRCKRAFYCSKECATKHWPQHKTRCLARAERFVAGAKVLIFGLKSQSELNGTHGLVVTGSSCSSEDDRVSVRVTPQRVVCVKRKNLELIHPGVGE